jgi:hypothetical protein
MFSSVVANAATAIFRVNMSEGFGRLDISLLVEVKL